MDDPSPLCPFSVHRMALIGKELGKEVGEWFGPSTAAGALKTLANSFPLCGLAVATAADSIVYKSDVFSASHLPSKGWTDSSVKTENRDRGTHWGSKSVLVLIGIRLGLDGVNPIYHDSVKASRFSRPQSPSNHRHCSRFLNLWVLTEEDLRLRTTLSLHKPTRSSISILTLLDRLSRWRSHRLHRSMRRQIHKTKLRSLLWLTNPLVSLIR